MFLLRTKLLKTNSLIVNLKSLPSYGGYRWHKLFSLINILTKGKKGYSKKSILLLTKLFVTKLFANAEFDKSLPEIHKKVKQSIFSYVGLRSLLNLPVWGQRTKTNASTPRLLAKLPWKRHFVQKWNRWKHETKEVKKKNFSKKKYEKTEKNNK